MSQKALTLREVWMLNEQERTDAKASQNRELHQVTARIGSPSYEMLLKLSEHWDIPKSALVAQIIEGGLQEFGDQLQRDAEKAAL
jgi:predicted DNA-binding protein